MTAVSAGRLRPAARIATELGAPWVVNVVGALILGFGVGSPALGVVAALATGGIPIAGILAGVRASRVSDHHVSTRKERHLIVVLILALVGAAWAVFAVIGAPQELVGFLGAAFVTLLALGVITAALRWKVSVHTAVLAGASVILGAALSPWWLLGLLTVPVVGWSRVYLRDHTVGQVAVGAVVGTVTAAVTYGLLT